MEIHRQNTVVYSIQYTDYKLNRKTLMAIALNKATNAEEDHNPAAPLVDELALSALPVVMPVLLLPPLSSVEVLLDPEPPLAVVSLAVFNALAGKLANNTSKAFNACPIPLVPSHVLEDQSKPHVVPSSPPEH